MSFLAPLVLVATVPALAGESPYNPGAAPTPPMAQSYYCTAQGIGDGKWYVTGFEDAPASDTPESKTFAGNASQAFTEYMRATYGTRKMMYPHCVVGPTEGMRPSWEQMQANPRFTETVHVSWHYGQEAAPAASSSSSD
jgi:hypothetical protein